MPASAAAELSSAPRRLKLWWCGWGCHSVPDRPLGTAAVSYSSTNLCPTARWPRPRPPSRHILLVRIFEGGAAAHQQWIQAQVSGSSVVQCWAASERLTPTLCPSFKAPSWSTHMSRTGARAFQGVRSAARSQHSNLGQPCPAGGTGGWEGAATGACRYRHPASIRARPLSCKLFLFCACRQAFMALQDVRSGTWLALFGAACLALRLAFSAAGSWKEPALLLGEAGTIACCLAPPLIFRVAGRRKYIRQDAAPARIPACTQPLPRHRRSIRSAAVQSHSHPGAPGCHLPQVAPPRGAGSAPAAAGHPHCHRLRPPASAAPHVDRLARAWPPVPACPRLHPACLAPGLWPGAAHHTAAAHGGSGRGHVARACCMRLRIPAAAKGAEQSGGVSGRLAAAVAGRGGDCGCGCGCSRRAGRQAGQLRCRCHPICATCRICRWLGQAPSPFPLPWVDMPPELDPCLMLAHWLQVGGWVGGWVGGCVGQLIACA